MWITVTHRTGLRIYCADRKKNPWWEGIRPIAEQYKMAGCITAKESELLWITSNLDLGDTMRERINRLAKGYCRYRYPKPGRPTGDGEKRRYRPAK